MVLKIYVDEDNNGFLLIMISCVRQWQQIDRIGG